MSLRVVLMVNFVPPYRLEPLRALARRLADLTILVSTAMEGNRDWRVDWADLNVVVQRCLTVSRTRTEPSGFKETGYVHVPLDTIPRLLRLRPDVVISGEFGARTGQAVLHRVIRRSSRLIVWATLSEWTERNRGAVRRLARRVILRFVDSVIVNGQSGKRYVESLGYPAERIVVANQISRTFLGAEKPPKNVTDAARNVLLVGRLVEGKGIAPFVASLIAWCDANPAVQITLTVAGDGPLLPSLRNAVYPSNLELELLGSVPFEELETVYARGDLLAFTTLADEWGLVVNEALSCGVPVLGSLHSQAVEELVTEGVTGWRFYPDRGDELDQALDRALTTDLETLARMGASGRERVKGLTAAAFADRVQDAITIAQGGRGPERPVLRTDLGHE